MTGVRYVTGTSGPLTLTLSPWERGLLFQGVRGLLSQGERVRVRGHRLARRIDSLPARAEEDDCHAHQADKGAEDVPAVGLEAVEEPSP